MTPRKKELLQVTYVRLPQSEHDQFVVASKRLGESCSRLLRRAVRDIVERPAHLSDQELAALTEVVYQLNAVGRNLNQLVRAVHVGKVTIVEAFTWTQCFPLWPSSIRGLRSWLIRVGYAECGGEQSSGQGSRSR